MKNYITILFLMLSIHSFSQSTLNYENVRTLDEINGANLADAYPWISSDGLRIYFTKEFNDTQELVVSERKDYHSDFSPPVIVPTGNIRPTSCWLSENELTAYVTDTKHLYFLKRSRRNVEFGPPIEIYLDGAPSHTFLTRASLDFSQNELFISILESGVGHSNMAQFKRTSDRSFSFEKYIELPFGLIPNMGQLSKDGYSLCVSVKDGDGGVKSYKLSRINREENFDFKSFQELTGFSIKVGFIGQLSVSSNMEWIIGVRNSERYWEFNDLFIAQKELFSSFDAFHEPSNVQAYPNPTTGKITIACGGPDVRVDIYSVLGQRIDSFISHSAFVNYQIEEEGVYVVKVFTNHGIQSQRVIVSPF